MKTFSGLVLAAGEGTRMKSDLPKVLHNICGRLMIDYVFDILKNLKLKRICVVANKKHSKVLDYLKQKKGLKINFQQKPLGTADAVKSAKAFLDKSKANVLIICADVPLIKEETLKALIEKHIETNSSCTILTTFLDQPAGFGRILRDQYSKVQHIIEENDAAIAQKEIKEINSGIYCFKTKDLLEYLGKIGINAKKKEYYLTDIIQIFYTQNKRIETCICGNSDEVLGINSRLDLARANEIMRLRIVKELAGNGVSIIDPKTTFIDYGVSIGKDTIIYPFTFIEATVKIGSNCSIGPFCHLRDATVVGDNTVVGNFTEIVRTSLGKKTFFKHFGYLGDASVGEEVNIGAGTVIANFDGEKKNHTVIKNKASIGCDTVIVAPAKIGKAVVTGAGSVITKSSNIKDNTVVVGIPAKPLVKNPRSVIKK